MIHAVGMYHGRAQEGSAEKKRRNYQQASEKAVEFRTAKAKSTYTRPHPIGLDYYKTKGCIFFFPLQKRG
jgi:hypothetical protein